MHHFVLSFLGACLRTSSWTIIHFPTRLGKALIFSDISGPNTSSFFFFNRHTISGVPIQSLNRLESLALDIFSYEHTVPNRFRALLSTLILSCDKMLEGLIETASRPCGDTPHPSHTRCIRALINAVTYEMHILRPNTANSRKIACHTDISACRERILTKSAIHTSFKLFLLFVLSIHDVSIDALSYLHNHSPGFPSLESLLRTSHHVPYP
jgi:hypothetical protein